MQAQVRLPPLRFAITPDGDVAVAQYLSLRHPDSRDDDEAVYLTRNAIIRTPDHHRFRRRYRQV